MDNVLKFTSKEQRDIDAKLNEMRSILALLRSNSPDYDSILIDRKGFMKLIKTNGMHSYNIPVAPELTVRYAGNDAPIDRMNVEIETFYRYKEVNGVLVYYAR